MAPNRRSQGDAPPPAELPSRPNRQKKPSSRAQDIVNTSQSYDQSSERSRQTVAQRRAHDEALSRKATAADRVRAQQQREEEEWKAQVAQFGEEEARRRLREERETRVQMNEPTTSDVEELTLEDKINNPTLIISACLRVNKKLEWSTSLDVQTLNGFSIWTLEQLVIETTNKRDGFDKGWKLTSHVVIIRASHSRATRILQSIDDLSDAEWEKAVKIIAQEAEKWRSEVAVRIEVSAEVDKVIAQEHQASLKRSHDLLSSDSAEGSAGRMTRTDKLLDQARVRGDVLKAAGNFDKELLLH